MHPFPEGCGSHSFCKEDWIRYNSGKVGRDPYPYLEESSIGFLVRIYCIFMSSIRPNIWPTSYVKPNIRYPAGYLAIYRVFGRICGQISGIRPDIRYSVEFLARYPVSSRIFGQLTCIRPDIWPDNRYPAGYQSQHQFFAGYLADRVSGLTAI